MRIASEAANRQKLVQESLASTTDRGFLMTSLLECLQSSSKSTKAHCSLLTDFKQPGQLARLLNWKNQQMRLSRPTYSPVSSNMALSNLEKVEEEVAIKKHTRTLQRQNQVDLPICYFQAKDASQSNIYPYLLKDCEFSICSKLQSIQLYKSDYQNQNCRGPANVIRRLAYRQAGLLNFESKKPFSRPYTRPAERLWSGESRDTDRRLRLRAAFNSVVVDFVTAKQQSQGRPLHWLAEQLRKKASLEGAAVKTWEIVTAHLSAKSVKDKVQASIKLMQSEFTDEYGLIDINNMRRVQNIARDHYCSGHFPNSVFLYEGRCIWAIAYVLYRAGLTVDQIFERLRIGKDNQVRRQFESHMRIGGYDRYRRPSLVEDPFYKALCFLLTCQGQVNQDIMRHDFTYLGLKTVNLDPRVAGKEHDYNLTLQQIQKACSTFYIQNPSEDNFKSLLYSLNYETALRPSFCGQFLDDQNSVHIQMIFQQLKLQEQALTQGIKLQPFQDYVKRVALYADNLLNGGLHKSKAEAKPWLCYLLLTSDMQRAPRSVPPIIQEKLNDIPTLVQFIGDPPSLHSQCLSLLCKFLENQAQLEHFLKRIADKYLELTKKYTYSAKIYKNLLKDYKNSWNLLLKLQLADLTLKKKATPEQLREAEVLIKDLLSTRKKPEELEPLEILQKFIRHYNKVSEAIGTRNIKSLRQELFANENARDFVPINGRQLPPLSQVIFNSLSELGFLPVYCKYVELIDYALELLWSYNEGMSYEIHRVRSLQLVRELRQKWRPLLQQKNTSEAEKEECRETNDGLMMLEQYHNQYQELTV